MPTPFPFDLRSSARQFVASLLTASCLLSPALGQEATTTPQEAATVAKPLSLPGVLPGGDILLPNGWKIGAVGTQVNVGDFPVNMLLTPDQR